MRHEFKFVPMQRVAITFNELLYKGRVLRCIHEGGPQSVYRVCYSDDVGAVKFDEFFEDELESK